MEACKVVDPTDKVLFEGSYEDCKSYLRQVASVEPKSGNALDMIYAQSGRLASFVL